MRAGDGDTLLEAHQLGQHLGARHHGNAALARHLHFRVVVLDGGGHHHRVGRRGHIPRAMADDDANAQPRQATRRGTFSKIRPAHLEALVGQHLGDAAHAGTTDADEVDAFDFVFHRKIPDRFRRSLH
jgi:hypothetical protein